MGLFSKPEVVIAKESSNAKEYLRQLEELAEKATGENAKKIAKEIAVVKAGIIGEDNILFLNNKQGDMYYIKNADGQVDLLVRTDNVALEEKSGLLSHISTAALLAVIAVLLAAGVWLLNWKKMKVKSKKSEEIAYFRPYLSSYTEERDGQRETMEK